MFVPLVSTTWPSLTRPSRASSRATRASQSCTGCSRTRQHIYTRDEYLYGLLEDQVDCSPMCYIGCSPFYEILLEIHRLHPEIPCIRGCTSMYHLACVYRTRSRRRGRPPRDSSSRRKACSRTRAWCDPYIYMDSIYMHMRAYQWMVRPLQICVHRAHPAYQHAHAYVHAHAHHMHMHMHIYICI